MTGLMHGKRGLIMAMAAGCNMLRCTEVSQPIDGVGQTLPSHSGLVRDQCLMFPASDQIADKSRMTKGTNFNRARHGRTDTN